MKQQPSDILNYKFKFDHFAIYGLNRHRSFMRTPKVNDFDDILRPSFESDDDLYEFCAKLLCKHGCPESAIFLVHNDHTFEAVMYLPVDEDDYSVHVASGNGYDFFSQLDGEVRFCCYGLMIQLDDGSWEICE